MSYPVLLISLIILIAVVAFSTGFMAGIVFTKLSRKKVNGV